MCAASGPNAPASEAPGRKRKYYSVTPKGRAELARRSEEWQAFTQAVNACLFGEALSSAEDDLIRRLTDRLSPDPELQRDVAAEPARPPGGLCGRLPPGRPE